MLERASLWKLKNKKKTTRCINVSNLSYFAMPLYMFRTVFPSIIRSSRLYIELSNIYCCLLASKQTAVYVWHTPFAVCTVFNSWWWTEEPSETCTQCYSNNINFDVCWTVRHCDNWRIKNQLVATYYFIVLLTGSTCFGHYYAHRQELATIMLITTLVISFCKDGGGSVNVKLWFLVVYVRCEVLCGI